MNRRNFISLLLSGIVAGPMLLKKAAQAKPLDLAVADFQRNPSRWKLMEIERIKKGLDENWSCEAVMHTDTGVIEMTITEKGDSA